MFDKKSTNTTPTRKITPKNKQELLSSEGYYFDNRLDLLEAKIDSYMDFTKTYVDTQISMFRHQAIAHSARSANASEKKTKNQFFLTSLDLSENAWLILAIAVFCFAIASS